MKSLAVIQSNCLVATEESFEELTVADDGTFAASALASWVFNLRFFSLRTSSYLTMSRTAIVFMALALLFTTIEVVNAAVISIGAAKDNTLFASTAEDLSNGAGQFLFVGTNAVSPEARRGLISFDVAGALPPAAVVNSVTLKLHMSRTISGERDASLHRLMQSWGEGLSNASGQEGKGATATVGDATWTHAMWPATPWLTPGGNFIAAPERLAPRRRHWLLQLGFHAPNGRRCPKLVG